MNAYVIVEHAGWDDPIEVIDFPTSREAYRYRIEHYDADEIEDLDVLIMKRLPDGSLTTEF